MATVAVICRSTDNTMAAVLETACIEADRGAFDPMMRVGVLVADTAPAVADSSRPTARAGVPVLDVAPHAAARGCPIDRLGVLVTDTAGMAETRGMA